MGISVPRRFSSSPSRRQHPTGAPVLITWHLFVHTVSGERMALTTLYPVRLLLLAVLTAGITTIVASPSTTDPVPQATEESPRGEAGTGMTDGLSAHAEGIAISGAGRMAARPSIATVSGRRLATEITVHAPGDLVTAQGVELSAAVIDDNTSAHAVVQHATYGRHDLGRLAVGCRNGVPTAERTGTVHLTTNVSVDYGQTRSDRITGATVLVLGPADRVTRIVRIAAVSCTSPYQPRTALPDQQPATGRDSADRIERWLVPRAPASSTRTSYLTVRDDRCGPPRSPRPPVLCIVIPALDTTERMSRRSARPPSAPVTSDTLGSRSSVAVVGRRAGRGCPWRCWW